VFYRRELVSWATASLLLSRHLLLVKATVQPMLSTECGSIVSPGPDVLEFLGPIYLGVNHTNTDLYIDIYKLGKSNFMRDNGDLSLQGETYICFNPGLHIWGRVSHICLASLI
jgi:hypothetical protein